MPRSCSTLYELWNHVAELNKKHFPKHGLQPILGGGKTLRPKIMFVFINPTAANISSDPRWKGPRFPFIGTKQVWRIFYRAGLLNQKLMDQINADPDWSIEFTDEVLKFLKKEGIYLTNIVKWTGHDATLPDIEKVKLFLPILKREIEIVKPEYVVTFGLIPFQNLTGEKIRLSDYHSEVVKSKKLKYLEVGINSTRVKVIPCYFPVGRGDPKKAVEILKLVRDL